MHYWTDSRLKALATFDGFEAPAFSNLAITCRDLGFDLWNYQVIVHQYDPHPLLTYSNLPTAWQEHYTRHRLYICDPIRRHGLHSLEPLRWTPPLFAQAPQLWHALMDAGWCHGMTQACHHPSGLTALLSIGRSAPQLPVASFIEYSSQVLILANQLTLASVERVAQDKTLDPADMALERLLSQREVGILRYTARGETCAQIAATLCLSERTVQFHISSATAKLGVPNKTAAVARALALGLLDGFLGPEGPAAPRR